MIVTPFPGTSSRNRNIFFPPPFINQVPSPEIQILVISASSQQPPMLSSDGNFLESFMDLFLLLSSSACEILQQYTKWLGGNG